jgi:hypothetical protein
MMVFSAPLSLGGFGSFENELPDFTVPCNVTGSMLIVATFLLSEFIAIESYSSSSFRIGKETANNNLHSARKHDIWVTLNSLDIKNRTTLSPSGSVMPSPSAESTGRI